MDPRRKNEIIAVILLAVAFFTFLSIFSFSPEDISFFTTASNPHPHNLAGVYGAYAGSVFRFFFGSGSYVIPFLLLVWGVSRLMQNEPSKVAYKMIGAFFLIVGMSSSLSMFTESTPNAVFERGGLLGSVVSAFLLRYLGEAGAIVFIAALVVLSALIATEFLILPLFSSFFKTGKRALMFLLKIPSPGPAIRKAVSSTQSSSGQKQQINKKLEEMRRQVEEVRKTSLRSDKQSAKKNRSPKIVNAAAPTSAKKRTKASPSRTASPYKDSLGGKDYDLPSLDLLDSPAATGGGEKEEVLKQNALILEKTLLEFGVEASVVKINKGPVITMYELEPALGTKVNKITSLSDNISMSMKSSNIRIVAPLPGKGTIGVEVPNRKQELVLLRDILESDEYQDEDSPLKLGLGKDLSGNPMVTDLARMPHLLIAGATGSGKTVCINTILCSMLFNASPEDLKLLLVDPKRVEMMIFEGVPHLICPIVTKAKKAAVVLNWVVEEMERRYKVFSEKSVRNIASYKEHQNEEDENMPYMVVVVDELADLMMVGKQDVEESIMRIAQLSRAAGIHMILATQRPSVNVITGVIKANFPARISFQVTSKVDSRTVLDSNGAEKLLGKGDMLLMQPGDSSLTRGQCSLVQDSEIRKMVNFIKKQGSPSYNEEILEKQQNKTTAASEKKDSRYQEAVRVVMETGQASVSMIQRRLRVGYTRAARMIDSMEVDGIVGPYNGSKPREIMVDSLDDVEGIE